MPEPTTTYRPDIDGLRAIAVLAVIIYHFFGDTLPSGLLGVDVFFVISGYVITSYLANAPKRSPRDMLVTFYARRIKRLLPALIVCVVVTTVLFLALTQAPRTLYDTAAAALIGFSNILLWWQSNDYFAVGAQSNPFTHTWSLGVEEQFYLGYPALFALFGYSWARKSYEPQTLLKALLLCFVVSLTSYLIASLYAPMAAFYLMPTRVWELAAGAIAFLCTKTIARKWNPGAAVVAMSVILCCFLVPSEFKTATTITVVVATAALLCVNRPNQFTSTMLSSTAFVTVGKLSYSLYLWHWSILILAKWTIGISSPARIAIVSFLTVAAAIASYVFVENPIRHSKRFRHSGATCATGIFTTLLLATCIYKYAPTAAPVFNSSFANLVGAPGLSSFDDIPCHGRAKTSAYKDPLAACLLPVRTLDKPNTIFLLGDSHAAQFFRTINIATTGTKYSVRFMNPEDYSDFPYGMIKGGSASRIFDYINKEAKPDDIIAIAFHRGHLAEFRDRHIPMNEPSALNYKTKELQDGLGPYIKMWAKAGIHVLLINDTPLLANDSPAVACALQIRLFGTSDCRVSLSQDLHTRARQDELFRNLAKTADNITLWDPLPLIYRSSSFLDVLDESGSFIMADHHHISDTESRRLASDFRAFLEKHYSAIK